FFFFQAEDGIRDFHVTGVQTCALPILRKRLTSPTVARELTVDDTLLAELSALSEGYSGAEIEQAVIAALFDAYAERRPLRADDLTRAIVNMVPLSVTQAERINGIRRWAEKRAVAATAAEDWDLTSQAGSTLDRAPRGGRAVEF